MTKYKKYVNYKKTNIDWLGEIPSHWDMLPNRAIFKDRTTRNCDNEELLSVTIKNGVIRQTQLLKNSSKKDSSNEDKSKYKLVKFNDIAYNKMRMWQGAVGVSNYQGIVSPAYIILNPIAEINANYYHYLYRSPQYIQYSYNYSYGICDDQLSLRYKDFSKMYSVIPPLKEQNKIVDFIKFKENQINKLIKKQKRLIELLEEKKKIIITETVTKGLDKSIPMKDSEIDYIGQIPSHWKIGYFFQLFTQVKFKNKNLIETNLLSLSYGKLKRKNINSTDGLLPENFEGYNIIEKNDIVLRLTDLQNDHTSLRVGFAIERGIITSAYVTARNKSNNFSKYLYYFLHSFDILKGFYGMGGGIRQGLNWQGLKYLKIILPPIEEQKNIADYLDKICENFDKIINNKNNLIKKLEEYKKVLISNAVTGQIDVRDYEIPETDDNINLEETDIISEDDIETINEVEYANN